MVKLIEMICTGNRGRSPVAELIARNHLKSIGAYGDYDSISSGTLVNTISGTLVNTIESGDYTLESMKPIIDVALQRPLYGPNEIKELEEALRQGNTPVVRKYFNNALDLFDREEVENRAEILPLLDIQGEVKSTRDQTVARPDTVAVFPIDRKNYSIVKELYENSDYSPVVDVLSKYATGNPDAELKNTFGKGKEVYRKGVEQMLEEVPIAVNRVIRA